MAAYQFEVLELVVLLQAIMGSMLDKPKTEWVDPEKGSSNGLEFGASSIQGWRTEMEVCSL